MYIDPNTVISPKGAVGHLDVAFDTGAVEESWSVAELEWYGRPAVGIRWNGEPGSGIGSPHSRNRATWFIVPDELKDAILVAAHRLKEQRSKSLKSGYEAMSHDREREAEAVEWTEGLLRDAG